MSKECSAAEKLMSPFIDSMVTVEEAERLHILNTRLLNDRQLLIERPRLARCVELGGEGDSFGLLGVKSGSSADMRNDDAVRRAYLGE